MKILLISNMYPSPETPSFGVFVKNMQHALETQGVNVEKVVIAGEGQNVIQKTLKYYRFISSAYAKIWNKQYDLIYIHNITQTIFVLLPILCIVQPLIVLNAHGSDLMANDLKSRLLRKLCFNQVQKAAMLVAPSSYFKDILKTRYHHSKVIISPSGGVNTKIFYPKEYTQNPIFTIGVVARIDLGKGWDVFLQAIADFRDSHPLINFRVIYAGGGTQVDAFKALYIALKLNNYIDYKGFIPQERLADIYQMFDLFVFATIVEESLGLVGVEAMACGIPVIGSNIGGLPDYIIDGYTGYLFKPGDKKELSEKMYKFYTLSKAEKNKMRKNAVNKGLEFEASNVAKKLNFEINNLLTERRNA
jgi:glycosyltransferase involved in cell wall biosynthesis